MNICYDIIPLLKEDLIMVFLDNASTTQVLPEVQEIINTYNTEYYYNPSALYGVAFQINKDISRSRDNILKRLGGRSTDNLIFTSCATESNNMALKACIKKNTKALISMGEHPSIFKTAQELKNNGFDIEFLKLKKDGTIDIEYFKKLMTKEIGFISIIHVNNETGAINDIQQIVRIAKKINPRVIIHSDGVQAFGKIDVNVDRLGVDLYTISGHKFHAPKGIGALFIRDGKFIKPLLNGGGQEFDLRSGTENVSGIFSLDKASEIVCNSQKDTSQKVMVFNQYVRDNLQNAYIISPENASPYVLMVSFAGCRAETLLHMMEDEGYLIGNGSACSSKKKENRNLSEMGYRNDIIEGAIRISFSRFTTMEQVKNFVSTINIKVNEYIEKVIK